MVPNHTDLLENNIHVDPNTGKLVGICDWTEVVVSPFGMSLGGLETMLGISTMKEGWCYHTDHQSLRDLFWDTFFKAVGVEAPFNERVEVARLVGIFLGNSWQRDKEGNKVPVGEESLELLYLDAVVLGLQSPVPDWFSGRLIQE